VPGEGEHPLEARVFPADPGRFGMLIADITERKQRHAQTTELYRSLFENMLNACAFCQMVFEGGKPHDLIFLAVNHAFESQSGLKDVVGRRITEVIPGLRQTDPQFFEIYARVAATGRPESFEAYINGLQAWFSASVYCPSREHFVIVFDRITERKRSEEALRASEQRYRTLANSGQALICTSTPGRTYDYFNQPWLEFTGRSLAQELSRGWADGVHPEDQRGCLAIYSAAFDRREAFAMEYRRRDGEFRWLREAGTPRYDHQGRFLGYIGHCLDITGRKRAEEAHRESARQMESALLEKTVLLQEIQHRVKNNLAVTDSLLNLKAETSPPEARQALQESRQRVHSIALVHEQLYSSDRLDRVDFGECARALARGVYAACTEPGRIGLDLDIDSIEVGIERAVPCALILNELLSNAFKHAFADGSAGRIRISFHRREPGWCELEVEDDGAGLPPGYLEGRHNSLGFRIVGILAHQLDGSVTQREGPGTRIALRFPWRGGTA
jgi:PAS domain S-box-containing protein